MNRRDFIIQTSLFTAGTAFALPRLLSGFTRAEVFTPLRRNVGIFQGRGGTIGWLADQNAVIAVDSQFPGSATDFLNGIGQYSNVPVDMLINTHHHGDHTGGNGVFRGVLDDIVAHEQVPVLQRRTAEAQGSADQQAYANITFADSWQRDTGDEIILLRHYGRAHTAGDAIVHFEKANIMHMGDLVFNRWYPFIDRDGGALISNWIEVLEKAVADGDRNTIYIFGHGNANYGITGDAADVLAARDYLSHLLEYTTVSIAAGSSREEITALEQFPEFPDHVSAGARLSLSANLNAAYDELTGP